MPALTPPLYAGNRFNRLAERRKDSAWLQTALDDARTRFMPLNAGRNLIASTPAPRMLLLSRSQLPVALDTVTWVLLGEFNQQTVVAVDLPETAPAPPHASEYLDLRSIAEVLDRHEAGLLGYARALLLWHRRHRFCSLCGAATVSSHAGHARQCSAPSCQTWQFPRLDPAIIVLVTDGDRLLLGRQAAWPANRYSTIAGFVEWGESIEEAVAREVEEETGVRVDEVIYHLSQPWPFPSSLMLGFHAQAATTTISLVDRELEDARWFTREALVSGQITLPPRQALSYRLIDAWYSQRYGQSLDNEPGVQIAGIVSPSR